MHFWREYKVNKNLCVPSYLLNLTFQKNYWSVLPWNYFEFIPYNFYNYPVITVYVVNFSITLHVPYFCLYCTKTVPFSSSSNHNDYYCNNDTTTTTTINNNYINNNNDDDDDNSIGGGFFKADIW